jgi:hypothetical protein
MVNKSITDYISKSRQKGLSDIDIKSQLEKVGWKLNDVDDAFKNLDETINFEISSEPDKITEVIDEPSVNNKNKTSVLAIISLILSLFLWPIGLILSIVALIKLKKSKKKGKWFAIAAIIISILMLFLTIGIFILSFYMVNSFDSVEDSMMDMTEQFLADRLMEEYNISQGLDSVNSQQDLLSCATDIDVEIVTVEGDNRVCHIPGSIKLFLRNSGQKDIQSWNMMVFGDEGYDSVVLEKGLNKSELGSYVFDFNFESTGSLSLIRISPKVQGIQDIITCTLPDLHLYNIEEIVDCGQVNWDDIIE